MNNNSYALPAATVWPRASVFLDQCYAELGLMDALSTRKSDVEREILETGSYVHTIRELAHGCRMAWRNSNRCIGRLYWKSLKVIDAREINEPTHVFDALQNHLDLAFNKGEVLSVITIFSTQADFQLLNHQLIRFAGHGNGI
ncbi:MAG: nitric oxide synthase oxygenase, partial [Bacteroidota bacterium]